MAQEKLDLWEFKKSDVCMVWDERLEIWKIKVKGKTVAILRGRGVCGDDCLGPLELIVYYSTHVYQDNEGTIYITL
jgi:hypothetical protein